MKLRRNIFNLKFTWEETAWEFFKKSSIQAVFIGNWEKNVGIHSVFLIIFVQYELVT